MLLQLEVLSKLCDFWKGDGSDDIGEDDEGDGGDTVDKDDKGDKGEGANRRRRRKCHGCVTGKVENKAVFWLTRNCKTNCMLT